MPNPVSYSLFPLLVLLQFRIQLAAMQGDVDALELGSGNARPVARQGASAVARTHMGAQIQSVAQQR